MPIYEFYSPDSHRIYSFLAKRFLKEGEVPICPDGPKHRMEKVVFGLCLDGEGEGGGEEGGGEWGGNGSADGEGDDEDGG